MDRGIEKYTKKKVTVVILCAMLFALCPPAEAQQPKKIPRIGYLGAFTPSAGASLLEAFRQGLRELGYVEGRKTSLITAGRRERPIGSQPLPTS